jgi:hypothetical protein
VSRLCAAHAILTSHAELIGPQPVSSGLTQFPLSIFPDSSSAISARISCFSSASVSGTGARAGAAKKLTDLGLSGGACAAGIGVSAVSWGSV